MAGLESFVSQRPKAEAAFGYGSGVFKQNGYNSQNHPQKDVIFLVDDIKEWHLQNMDMNPKDYSLIGRVHLSRSSVEKIKGLNKITYFSHIKNDGENYKYGVIEEKDFLHNLSTWENIFVAGRFQKPILRIHSNEQVDNVISYDRECALRIACLLSPKIVSAKELLVKLCGLSYYGDTRMLFAENPNKVGNIVDGSFDILKGVYIVPKPYLEVDNLMLTINHRMILNDINYLPSALIQYLHDINIDLKSIEQVRKGIMSYIKAKNKEESFYQTLDGFKTNGVVRSVPYALAKVKKKIVRK